MDRANAHSLSPMGLGRRSTRAPRAGVQSGVVSSLHVLYERAFDQEHRGWRDLPRYLAYVGILFGVLIVEASISGSERRAAGRSGKRSSRLWVVTIFFGWTMHFLLAGRVAWRLVIRPALFTALLWVALHPHRQRRRARPRLRGRLAATTRSEAGLPEQRRGFSRVKPTGALTCPRCAERRARCDQLARPQTKVIATTQGELPGVQLDAPPRRWPLLVRPREEVQAVRQFDHPVLAP